MSPQLIKKMARKGKCGKNKILRICIELKEDLNKFLNWKRDIGEEVKVESH